MYFDTVIFRLWLIITLGNSCHKTTTNYFAMNTVIKFTPRETAILKLVASNKSIKEISAALNISVKTVGSHLKNIYAKAGIHSFSQLVAFCIRNGY